jgi:hypothetical protein
MPRDLARIRLVGGPAKLDGTVCDLGMSDHDRADATGRRFVRVTDGSTITALSALCADCRDHEDAVRLASRWRAAVYRPGSWSRRTRVYRFAGYYSLEPRRDDHGRWSVAVAASFIGSTPPVTSPPPTLWTALERAVDDAAARFATVAGLVPPGPLAERAAGTRVAVDSCVADAHRLCAVGSTIAPDAPAAAATEQTQALVARVSSLVRTIDLATGHVVDLHLEVQDTLDPIEPIATLTQGLAELRAAQADVASPPDRT